MAKEPISEAMGLNDAILAAAGILGMTFASLKRSMRKLSFDYMEAWKADKPDFATMNGMKSHNIAKYYVSGIPMNTGTEQVNLIFLLMKDEKAYFTHYMQHVAANGGEAVMIAREEKGTYGLLIWKEACRKAGSSNVEHILKMKIAFGPERQERHEIKTADPLNRSVIACRR